MLQIYFAKMRFEELGLAFRRELCISSNNSCK